MSRGSTPRRADIWVSLCNLMLKLDGISLSSGRIVPRVTIGRETPFIPRERHNVKHFIAGYLMLTQPTPAPALMQRCIGTAVEQRNQGTPLAIHPKIIARYEEAAASLG